MPGVVLARWEHADTAANTTTVLPDGCRDLILRRGSTTGQVHWLLSPLDTQARQVTTIGAGRWIGFRLRPGAQIDDAALLRAARQMPPREALDAMALLAIIDQHAQLDARTVEALDALHTAPSVAHAARALGVSPRSLERLLHQAIGQPPRYWRALARVRRAAQALADEQPLAAIAADHGYADQAHFSRECLRWLGQAPSALRRSPALLATVAQAGYGG